MKTNNIILALFIAIFFSACFKKINNTYLNEDYKTLNQVSIVGTLETTYINYPTRNFILSPTPCEVEKENDFWLNSIIDKHKFSEILEAKGIEVLDFGKPVKRLIFIRPSSYRPYACEPISIIVDIFLYDVEDISKTWNLKSHEDIIKEMDLLKELSDLFEDKNLIYTNRYILDIDFNPFEIYTLDYGLNKTKDRDVKKFFNKVVEGLEKVVKFPNSLNP